MACNLFAGLESFGDLERRIAALPTQQDRGDAFEAFAEAYLATQNLIGAEDVWPTDQCPIAVLQACSLPINDLGADGVYKTWAAQHNAYQVKFRTGRPALTWQELSTFMGLTDQVGERVLVTNCDDLPEVMDARSGFFCIRGSDLDRLTKEDLEVIAEWLRGAASAPRRKEPLPHQREALEAILAGLKEHDRVTAVMACGTGKTLVSLWLAERTGSRRVLVLVPSLALIRQTLHEWLKETSCERPRFIAVCSDPTVVKGADDALIVHQRDLDFPVTTNAEEVCNFLRSTCDGPQIVFSTYQSAHIVGEAAKRTEPFDLGVFDEAHKTAGREGAKFGFALEDRNLPIRKRVFMTATPRHYDVRKKDKEGDKALVYSMDQPAIYGPIVHTLSFAEAARRDIICNYKVIISVVTSDMINADFLNRGEVIVAGDVVRARTVANQIAIQKACEAHDLRKVFSFHRSVASARDFTGNTASSIKVHLPDYATHHVNGEMQTARREKEMREFREAERGVMSNARCLTEGVDVPAVDVVAFLSPRKSKVDIVQAAGRAMRKVPGKETGYVLLPLFLETQENETIEEALERTDFEEAWDVLQAMQEQDAVLAEIIREMREERGRLGGFDDSRLRERVEVLGPEVDLNVLRDGVSTALIERLGATWDERYGELSRCNEQWGNCNVPENWPQNTQLARWVMKQRARNRAEELAPVRKQRLNDLGFDWDPRRSAWEAMFTELTRYNEQFGDCNVPRVWKQSPQLATWVRGLRKRPGRLSADKKARLDELGFEWDPYGSAWEAVFAELIRYKERFGDCNVPRSWGENPPLGMWVGNQRQFNRNGRLSVSRRARLNEEGFDWDAHDATWQIMLVELKRYKERFGDCNVPQRWADNPQLANWVNNHRKFWREGTLTADNKLQLDELGFEWEPRGSAWEAMFAALKRYKERYGDCNVPRRWKEDPSLATWVGGHRSRQRQLSAEHRACLDELGFDWVPYGSGWEAMFAELSRYKERFGECNVLRKDNPQLCAWVLRQRRRQRQLSAGQRARLDQLGFEWAPRSSAWETTFAELKRYKERFGDCNVPAKWAESPKLGAWVHFQRAQRRTGKLSAARETRLNELGFIWKLKAATSTPSAASKG